MLKVNMRTGETEQCSLLDLMDGGVKELADRDLQRVLENLKDVNTDPKKARSASSFTPPSIRSSRLHCSVSPVLMLTFNIVFSPFILCKFEY